MTKNGKKGSKNSLNGHKKKVNGSLYILMKERNENEKRMKN